MRKLSFTLLIVIAFLVSCGPKITKEQQEKLSSLKAEVDSIATLVNKIDSIRIKKMTEDFFNKKRFVQVEMTDTIDRKTLFRLDSFVQLRKGMGFLQGDFSEIRKEAQTMQQQMVDLEHDVDHRLVEEKKFNTYFNLEQENFDKLKSSAIQLIQVEKSMTEQYNAKVDFVDSLIAAYKAKINE